MNWVIYASGTAVGLAAADIFIKLAAGKVSNGLALLLYGSCTFLSGAGWALWQHLRGEPFQAETSGVLAAIAVGVCFSLVTVGLYATFRAGAPISLASPFIRLGGLLLASIAGFVLFKEPVTWRYATGILLACIGVYLIITK